jgi:hypothetical protein
MRKCIFCNEIKDDSLFNDEHIVLKSLGGNVTLNCVCTECNSNFGASVDTLASETLIGVRFLLNLAGRSGVPNPYYRQYTTYPLEFLDDIGNITNVLVRMELDDKGVFQKCTAIPRVYDYKDGKLIVSDKKNSDGFTRKMIKEHKLLSASVVHLNNYRKYTPKVLFYPHTEKELDYFSLCCYPIALKMSYEYLCEISKMKYLDDVLALSIRPFLKGFDKRKELTIPTDAECNCYYDKMDEKIWEEWMNLPDHNITINVKTDAKKIIATVDMFHFFNYKIVMSEDASRYPVFDETVCNEITSKIDSFKKISQNFKIDIVPIYVR